MTKKSSSVQVEAPASEILDENGLAVDDIVDEVVSEETMVPEEVPVVKKKAASRKKSTSTAAGSGEAKVKKATTKRSRIKIDKAESTPPAPVMKAFWGVFNPMMVQVAQYKYSEEDEARKIAAEMTEKKKAPHFVQLVKKVL